MLSDLFSCPICYVQFDKTSHVPKTISSCSHTLCSQCITSLLGKNKECPLDRIKFPENIKRNEDFPTPLVLLQIIEEKQKAEYQTCKEHAALKTLICLEDKTWICEKCASSPKHKNHNIKSTQQLKAEAQPKKKKLERWLEEFTSQKEEAQFYFKGLQKSIATNIAQEFKRITDVLKMKEKEIFTKIEALFETSKNEMEKTIEEDESLKETWEMQISDLDNNINMRFIDTFKKLDDKKYPNFEISKLLENAQTTEKQYISAVQAFTNIVISAIKDNTFRMTEDEALEVEKIVEIENRESCDLTKFSSLFEIEVREDYLTVYPLTIPEEKNKELLLLLKSDSLKNIKTLELQFVKENLTEQYFQGLKHIHTYCDQLSSLKLFFDDENVTDDDLSRFCLDSYWATTKLENFVLDLGTSRVSDTGMRQFCEKPLPKMLNIKSLNLWLANTLVTDQFIEISNWDFISNFSNLWRLNFGLDGTNVSDNGILKLCKCIKPISKNLKAFGIGLRGTQVTDESIISLALENLRAMNNLEDFVLDIGSTKATDKSLSILSNILCNMSSLKDFAIQIDDTKIADSGFRDFCKNLHTVAKNLESLDLNLSIPGVTDMSIVYFSKEVLPQLKSLKTLKVILRQTQIMDNGLEELSKGLKYIFQNLQEFSLNLEKTNVTLKGIKQIINLVDLPSMPDLKSFDFDFPKLTTTSDIQSKLARIRYDLALRNK